MAYTSSLFDDLTCSVCCDIFKDPVILSCSHSFCKGCLQTWWTEKQEQQCPLCKRRSSKTDPPRNIALKNLSEAFQRENADLCALHGEKLKLFCLNDLETACVICRDSEKHANHRFLPVDEAAASHREDIEKLLKTQKEKLEHFVETKRKCEDIAAHIDVQTAHTERQIQKEFEKLHQYLKDEEKSRITALRGEEEFKVQKMEKEIEELSTFSHTVTETEQQLVADDISFLKKFKATREKLALARPLEALPQGALLDVAKHLGNLAHAVWKKLEENVSYFPVILDPNTAGPDLHLSEDLTSVRYGARQQLPENPERLKYGVLGSEPLKSETGHSSLVWTWEAEVGDSANWELGVNIDIFYGVPSGTYCVSFPFRYPVDNYFKIGLHNGRYRSVSSQQSGEWIDLPAMQKLQRIRMNWYPTTHVISFSDPKTNQAIHSWIVSATNVLQQFNILPFINSTDTVPLKISPGKEL
uniref:Tripartite motif-containing protein 35-like n=2 Tax=Gadus morhua TaxID=8049 RepID=A0A8C5CZJ1_GADMO